MVFLYYLRATGCFWYTFAAQKEFDGHYMVIGLFQSGLFRCPRELIIVLFPNVLSSIHRFR
jgi:hypothetical protein